MMRKRVIITGAAGFTGKYMVNELVQHGYEVIGTYHNKIYEDGAIDCRWYKIDMTDCSQCNIMLQDLEPEAVIHLAARNNMVYAQKNPAETIHTNMTVTVNLLDAVRQFAPECRVILAGSAAVYKEDSAGRELTEGMDTEPQNAYALTKVFQEKLACFYGKMYNMKVLCTRPFNYTGAGQEENCFIPSLCRQVSNIANGQADAVIRMGNISVQRDFSDVRDVVCAYRMLLEADDASGIYNICSGNAVRLEDIVKYVCSKSNRIIRVEQDSNLCRANDAACICGNNRSLKKDTGWIPRYNIFDTIDWIYGQMQA